MRQEARLRQPVETGGTVRDHLRMLAAMGKESARRSLRVPPCPLEVRYLVEWSGILFGRSGCSPVGLLPLSPSVLHDWAALAGEKVEPHEADALFLLDYARLNPGKAEVKVERDPTKKSGRDLWAAREKPVDA